MKSFIYREWEEFKAAPMWRKILPVALLVIVGGIALLQVTGVIGGSDPITP